MTTFDKWLTERASTGIEITTTKGREHKKDLEALGLSVTADAEGVIVQVKGQADARKLKKYLKANGWDDTDIKDAYPEL